MDRINDPTATEDRKFQEASGATPATRLRAPWLNGVQEELLHIIEEEGLAPSGADLTQLKQALDRRFPRWRDAVTKVANITELRALTGLVDGQAVEMTGTGRAGLFYVIGNAVDFTAETASDPREGIYVQTTDGKLLKRSGVGNSVFAPWFGVLANGTDDDHADLQGSSDYATAVGAKLELPPTLGTYIKTLSTWVVDDDLDVMGCGQDTCTIQCDATDGSDAIQLSATKFIRGINWAGFRVISGASAGHCIEIGFGLVRSDLDISLQAINPAKGCIYGSFISQGGVYACAFGGGEYRLTPSHTVAGVKFVTDGARVQTSRFVPRRVYYGRDEQFFWIENSSSGSWCSGNEFRGIEAEITNGGLVALFGCRDTDIDRLLAYDLAAENGGLLLNDGILLSSVVGGIACEDIRISRYSRVGAALDAGVYDINLADAQDTVFVNMSNPTAWGVGINVNNKRITWVGSTGGISFTGLNQTNSTIIDTGQIKTPSLITPRQGATSVISAGAIPAPVGSFFAVDTEASAASDDLDTIPAGLFDGHRITLRQISSGRDVTIKHATGNIYTKSAADVLLGTVYVTISFIWDATLSAWLEV